LKKTASHRGKYQGGGHTNYGQTDNPLRHQGHSCLMAHAVLLEYFAI
jgi:hypothetical protein